MMLHGSPPVRLGKGICFRHSLAAVCYQLWVSIVGFARYLNKIVLQALSPQMKSSKWDTYFEGIQWESQTKGNLYDEEEEEEEEEEIVKLKFNVINSCERWVLLFCRSH